MFVLTVFKEGIAKNDIVPDEPRRKIVEVSMLSYYGLCCRRIELTGFITFPFKNYAKKPTTKKKDAREDRESV